MIRKTITTSLTLWIFLAGCVPSTSPLTVSTSAPVTKIPLPMPTTSAPTTTGISTPKSSAPVATLCPSVVTDLPTEMVVEGQFVLEPLESDKSSYLLDYSTGTQKYLPYTEGYYPNEFRVSPNHQWIAYFTVATEQTTDNSKLIVTDLNGKIAYQQPMSRKEWHSLDTWLNEDILMLERNQYLTFPDGSSVLDTPLPVTLLNPFTSETKDLAPNLLDMPPFFDPLIQWDVYGKSGTAYDPSSTLVAYANIDQDNRETITLWDLNKERELANLQAPIGFAKGPVWSPDGSQFITVSLTKIPTYPNWTENERLSQELFSVSRAGKITRLTHLTDQFQKVSIGGYTWSPDGNRIAFIVSAESDDNSSMPILNGLSILDIQTKQVTMFCINSTPTFRIFWSPNGQQILAGVESDKKSNIADTILIDLTQNLVVKIADNTTPLGWMITK